MVICQTALSGWAVRGCPILGTPPAARLGSHDGHMAGLEGVEQPRHGGDAAATRLTPAVEDEQTRGVLELFGNPTEAEVRLPSRPESALAARRLTHVVVLRQWALSPQMAEHAVLLVSELVGNAVRHTGARVFGLRMLRRRGWIRVEVRDLPRTAVPAAGARDGYQRAGAVPGGQALRPVGRGSAAARQDDLVRDAGVGPPSLRSVSLKSGVAGRRAACRRAAAEVAEVCR